MSGLEGARMESDNVWTYRLRAAKIPFIIIASFYLLSLITGLLSFSLYQSIFMNSLLAYVVIIAAFTIGAHVALVDYEIPQKRVIQGGVLAGLGLGLLSAFISIILLKHTALMGASVDLALAKIAASGSPLVDRAMLETTIMIGAYLSIVLSPIVNGAFGALFSWIGVLVTNKFISPESTNKALASPVKKVNKKK